MTNPYRRTGNSDAATFPRLKQAAEDLLPLIQADAAEAETLTHQTDRVAAELRGAGLWSMLLPEALGGAELPFVEAMQIVERITWADGSAGWCTMVPNVVGASVGASLPDEGAQTIFGPGPDVIVVGNGVPRGFATPVDGGYIIRGNWSYGSGIYHADWVHSGCFVMDGDKMKLNADRTPEIVLMHHPKGSVRLTGNWDTLGLRATGSYDYTLQEGEIFVPHHMTYKFDGAPKYRGGPQYGIGLVGLTAWGHTSWALGVGRRALDEINRLANERNDVFGLLADSITFRKTYAEAEAKYRSARAFVYESWNSLADTLAAGEPAGVQQIALIRLAMRHIHDTISEVATFAHKASRGVSLRNGRLQTAYRDAHSGTQHLLLADEIQTECGRALLGRTGPGATWTMFGVKG
jgi:alkylation response protein AidB-like acyl-CoA dehydrogenase